MPVLIRSKIDVKNFPSKRAWRAAMVKGHDAQGQHWHQHMLKDHFRRNSRERYGYKPRSERYQRRKQFGRGGKRGFRGRAKYMGLVDLVLAGDLESGIRGFATIRSFPSRVTVAMIGPSYLTINYKPNRPNLAREITATVPEEENKLAEVMDAVVTREMQRTGDTRTITT